MNNNVSNADLATAAASGAGIPDSVLYKGLVIMLMRQIGVQQVTFTDSEITESLGTSRHLHISDGAEGLVVQLLDGEPKLNLIMPTPEVTQ